MSRPMIRTAYSADTLQRTFELEVTLRRLRRLVLAQYHHDSARTATAVVAATATAGTTMLRVR